MSERSNPPVRVDFMLIGGTKCATTWLSKTLRAHPEIAHSAEKSPDFFSTDRYERGWDTYARQWTDETGVRGESSTSYLYSERALERIRRWFPGVRILLVLRDPWERALSHVHHKLRTDHPDDLEAYLAERPHLVTDGFYAGRLKDLYGRFPEEAVRVFFFEEVASDPLDVARRAYAHVGVDPTFDPPEPERPVGSGFTPRSRRLERVKEWVGEALRSPRTAALLRTLKTGGLYAIYRWINARSSRNDEETRARIERALRSYLVEMIADVRVLTRMTELGNAPFPRMWLAELERRREGGGSPGQASSTSR